MSGLIRMISPIAAVFLLAGCIATAPVSFSWRSNASQQYATTDGRAFKEADRNTVNADRTSELQNAIAAGSGDAATAAQAAVPADSGTLAGDAATEPDAATEAATEPGGAEEAVSAPGVAEDANPGDSGEEVSE